MSSSKLLWDAQDFSRKQVPTVQDALVCCDKQTLLYVVERMYASRLSGWGNSSPQQRRVARKRMVRALETMRQCQIKRKEGKSFCVFPEEEFVVHVAAGRCVIERALQGRVADVSRDALLGGAASQNISKKLPFGYNPWAVALAYRIWLEGPWNCQERYMVLASVFWQLTHQGFGESRSNDLQGGVSAEASCGQNVLSAPSMFRPMQVETRSSTAQQFDWAFGRDLATSVSEEHASRAKLMGLGVPEALEDAYKDRLISRVAQLNEVGERDFQARVLNFSQRLYAA